MLSSLELACTEKYCPLVGSLLFACEYTFEKERTRKQILTAAKNVFKFIIFVFNLEVLTVYYLINVIRFVSENSPAMIL